MLRLGYIACMLTLFSCNKDYHIPASVLYVYTSSNFCDSQCSAQIWLVSYSDDKYYGSKIDGLVCPDSLFHTFYYTDGSIVESSDLSNALAHQGKYERILWQCTK
jgi:hypothetical protein